MKKVVLFVLLLLAQSSFAQKVGPLVKQWDARFGGTVRDWLTCSQQTSDGGYIMGGYTNSPAGGDITQAAWGGQDWWVVKTDSLGNKQWDKRYGGSNDDMLNTLLQTPDGGYLLVGYSASGISGNKSTPCFNSNSNYGDFWVVKIDASGNKLWDKCYGGTDYDMAYCIQPTLDGNYIIGGISYSGGVNGNKTSNGPGGYDYWIVKIDAQGNKLWDKSYGGNSTDYLYYILPTRDKGYILGGTSYSNAGNDKTDDDLGDQDYWVIKVDSLGNKQWDKTFGGSQYDEIHSIYQTSDGGYVLAGFSYSGADGNKTSPSFGGYDFWLVKVDANGNKLWEKEIGGPKFEDDFGYLTRTADGGFLISGTSYSAANTWKSENNLGAEQGWLVKLDSSFNEQWDKTIFASGHDEQCYGYQTKDGGYAAAIFSYSDTGGYKTQHTRGDFDYWLIKFRDTSSNCPLTNAGLISAIRDTICPNTVARLNLGGNSGTVQWQSSATGTNFTNISGATGSSYNNVLSKTTYYRTFTGSGKCADTSAVFQLVVAPAAFASFINTNTGLVVNFNSDSSTGGVTLYHWDFGDGDTSNLPNPIHTYGKADSFHVCLSVFNKTNCDYTTCHDISVSYPEGVTNISSLSDFTFYPDPFSNEFYISSSTESSIESIEVYNVLGQIVLRKYFGKSLINNMKVDASGLTNGVYYLKIGTHQQVYIQPLIKE